MRLSSVILNPLPVTVDPSPFILNPSPVTLSPDLIGTKGLQLFLMDIKCRFFAARKKRAPLRMTYQKDSSLRSE